MAEIPRAAMPHTITIEPLAGQSAYGDTYGPGVLVPCNWQGGVRLVRDANGDQVTASGTGYAPLSIPGLPGGIPTDSRVTTPSGATSYVIAAIRHDDGDMGGWQHTEIACQ